MKNTGTLLLTTPSEREIVLTRVFDAPRHLVFEAFTKPELLKRWLLGPPGWSMVVCEVDFRVGGSFRYIWRNPEGGEMGMHGLYREIVPCERSVNTESFDFGCTAQSHEQLVTTTLVEHEGKTTMTATILYQSKEDRDAVIASGMEHGVTASYDRLAELLVSTETMATNP